MFLTLNHQKLDAYLFSKILVVECYKFTKQLPADEKYGMASQIKRAALSVHLNIAEGASRNSSIERNRYFEIARGSIIEIDAALDVAKELLYFENYNTEKLGDCILKTFKIISGLIKENSHQ